MNHLSRFVVRDDRIDVALERIRQCVEVAKGQSITQQEEAIREVLLEIEFATEPGY